MPDRSPYAGKTVLLRSVGALAGQSAEIVDSLDNLDVPADGPKAEDYAIRRAIEDLPDDGDTLYARVDGMMRIIHVTEIDGYAPPTGQVTAGPIEARDIGANCPACDRAIRAGDMVSVLVLGPGADPDARAKAKAKQPYDAACAEVHWACRTGDESYEMAAV
jgi:hypothetical protein